MLEFADTFTVVSKRYYYKPLKTRLGPVLLLNLQLAVISVMYLKTSNLCKLHTYMLGLKQTVNLLSRYPGANICRYPTDSDIVKFVLLAILF